MGAVLVPALLAALWASQAPAQDPPVSERIKRGETLLEALEYEEAAQELMLALGDRRATEEELLKANLLAGIANRVLDRNVEARLNFHYVLTRAPDTTLPPDTAPKIATFFELVRREVEAEKVSRDTPATPPDDVAPQPANAPASPREEGGLGVIFWSGAVVLGASTFVALVLAASAASAEVVRNIPAVPGSTKGLAGLVGQLSLVALLLPPLGLIAGAGLVGWGLFE